MPKARAAPFTQAVMEDACVKVDREAIFMTKCAGKPVDSAGQCSVRADICVLTFPGVRSIIRGHQETGATFCHCIRYKASRTDRQRVSGFQQVNRKSPNRFGLAVLPVLIFPLCSPLWLHIASGQPADTKRGVALVTKDETPQSWAALVIGNSRYRHASTLKNANNDAEDFGQLLRRSGYHVSVQKDLTLSGMRAALAEFVKSARNGGRAVFFFAGHGVQIDGENYLIPIEFAAPNQEAAKAAGVALKVTDSEIFVG